MFLPSEYTYSSMHSSKERVTKVLHKKERQNFLPFFFLPLTHIRPINYGAIGNQGANTFSGITLPFGRTIIQTKFPLRCT